MTKRFVWSIGAFIILALMLAFSMPATSFHQAMPFTSPVSPSGIHSERDAFSNPTPGALTIPVQSASSTGTVAQPTANKSELDFAVGPAALIVVTDPVGDRIGRDSATSTVLQEIPQSTYYEDSMSDNTGTNHFINIGQPNDGRYSVLLSSLQPGEYQLSIRAFSTDGNSQPEIQENGRITEGTLITFTLNYRSAPQSVSSLSSGSQN